MDGCDRCSELPVNLLKINAISFASSERRDSLTCPTRLSGECRKIDGATVAIFGIGYQGDMRSQAPNEVLSESFDRMWPDHGCASPLDHDDQFPLRRRLACAERIVLDECEEGRSSTGLRVMI